MEKLENKEVNVKIAKKGIYYLVSHNHNINKIDFVKYEEKIFKDVYVGYGEYEDKKKCYVTYLRHYKGMDYTAEETKEWGWHNHLFNTLEDAKEFVIESYYKKNIKNLHKQISKEKKEIAKLNKLTDDRIFFN